MVAPESGPHRNFFFSFQRRKDFGQPQAKKRSQRLVVELFGEQGKLIFFLFFLSEPERGQGKRQSKQAPVRRRRKAEDWFAIGGLAGLRYY